MSRRRYLFAYDIANPFRLRKTCDVFESHGTRLQYSVFLCHLTRAELEILQYRLINIIDPTEDSIIRIDLGPQHSPADVHQIGRPRHLPHTGPQII
ncbi:CRISPR-associated endonuclease Cas2 [Saccharopolyspora hattusasensis]|uniref:CRISPR-associated endonuclease Cas2 n=1 Tax=Saccharopolyspora hattusasensis TaxID=1128679 RepID=UPI003D984D1C